MTEPKSKPDVGTAKPEPPTVAEMNLWQKLATITGEIGAIAKDGKNASQNYAFIEYASVAGSLRTLFAKYGVVCIPDMINRQVEPLGSKGVNVTIDFTFTFKNADKPSETEVIHWTGEANDYGDKATNKAATAALKYCLMRTFNISEQGDDPDGTSIERVNAKASQEPAQPPKPTAKEAIAKASGVLSYKGFTDADERKAVLLRIAGVTEVKDLTLNKIDHVMGVLSATTGDELRQYLADAEKAEEAVA